MFWQAASVGAQQPQLPGLLIPERQRSDDVPDAPHARSTPSASARPARHAFDEVKVNVHLQAIGDDVLASQYASGDHDATNPPQIARYSKGGSATLDRTPKATNSCKATDSVTGAIRTCVSTGALQEQHHADHQPRPAARHRRLSPETARPRQRSREGGRG